MTIVSFTGHRPDKIGGYRYCDLHEKIKTSISEVLISLKPTKVISGMALGVDQLACDVCLKLNIPIIAAVPFQGQEKIWPEESKKYYHSLLERCCEVKYVSPPGYAAWKMIERNKWMVDNSDTLIAVWNGSSGGTKQCVEYAVFKSKKIIYINPSLL